MSSSSSNCLGFSGSKSFSIINDLNLLLRPFLDLIFLSITAFSKLSFEVAVLVFIFADKLSLWALPITAFLLIPPIISAIWLAVFPLPHNSFNLDIGLPSKLYFKDEVKKYSYMWRDGGEFSTEKYHFGNTEKKN